VSPRCFCHSPASIAMAGYLKHAALWVGWPVLCGSKAAHKVQSLLLISQQAFCEFEGLKVWFTVPLCRYVRNTTARAFSVVASALGIPALLPFLKAVCQSKKSWQARHTGIKIVQQISILLGCAVLPHLKVHPYKPCWAEFKHVLSMGDRAAVK
jgi:hypothetical protein